VAIPPDLLSQARYEILGLLGRGGMGTVFKARHRLMGREVALKVVNAHLLSDPQMVMRFRREVWAAARLLHPNIVTAYDADQAGDTHFLVMEYIEGVDLNQVLAGPDELSVRAACEYAMQTALGLQHAHEQGMVHRDVKPHNLMLTPQGQVKILDFGLARLASETLLPLLEEDRIAAPKEVPLPAGELTSASTGLGTADYLAPEEATNAHQAEIRADIYSLGCTLYRFLTGRVPFPGGDYLDKVRRHREETPPSVGELREGVPPRLGRVVERMLAKCPADRYQTPREVAQALLPFASNSSAHVLVVDDDPKARHGMGQFLEAEGYSVRTAANGREALDCLRQGPVPAVILLDLKMPVMDGWEFLQEQRADPALASIPVVVISATNPQQARAAALGAADYLQKPVLTEELAEKVQRHASVAGEKTVSREPLPGSEVRG